MLLDFKSLIIKNFLSYADAEISLDNRGYCLIKGENHYKPDLALSNGSGKSSIINALCWALTGETTNKITNNVKNINIDEKECWVKVTFYCDNKLFEITRYNQPRSDLKIIIDGEDKSGKGIRESQAQLENLIPDLSSDLISSVIILGQGLPNKLSSHSPSGRKELLESLSKSDFMIQDIKERIANREDALSINLRQSEDQILKATTELNLHNNLKEKIAKELTELKNTNYQSDIKIQKQLIDNLDIEIKSLTDTFTIEAEKKAQLENTLNAEKVTYLEKINQIKELYNVEISKLNEEKISFSYKLSSIENELIKLKNITDICPTCGQKIPNIIKPDLSSQEKERAEVDKNFSDIVIKLESKIYAQQTELQQLNTNHIKDILAIQKQLNPLVEKIAQINNEISTKSQQKNIALIKYSELVGKSQSLQISIEKLQEQYAEHLQAIAKNEVELRESQSIKNTQLEHLAVIHKISTLVKRDFRGYLLTDIIRFLDEKAKEYARDIFENENIEIKIDGNDIDIYFNNKLCETLSGGERQKVDLIIQLAIRELLTTYLNFHSSIICLDEITDNLDALGCNKIFNIITNKLKDIESVFIISHHENELQIPVDTEINVIKDINGISRIFS